LELTMKSSTSFSSQRVLASSLSIALLALSMGCSPQPVDAPTPPVAVSTIGSELDDTVVTTSVKAALLAEESIKSMDIKIETNKGVVQLSGFVNDNKQIDRAVAVAQAVAGVKGVQSRMVLKDGASTMGSNLDDTVITSRVKAALLADKDTKSTDIGVETRKGEVMLSGFVATKSQIALAQTLAAKQEGVTSVRNELSVKK
jgi:hyperosmotically inducible periplasmic protein